MVVSLTALQPGEQTEYDLHGLVGIRLINAPSRAGAAVTAMVGPPHRLAGKPDIVVRFVDRLDPGSCIHYVGGTDVGFTDDALMILRGSDNGTRACIDFQQIGKRCQIVCETGAPEIPLLIPIIHWTMLAKGILPLHASGFAYEGTGTLVAGWSHGGKTGTLLAFMRQDARFVGDDWVYLSHDGRHMHGLPSPIEVKERYLAELPPYRAPVGWCKRARLRATRLLVQALNRVTPRNARAASIPAKILNRLSRSLEGRLYLTVHPQDFFGYAACPLQAALDKVVLLVHHESPELTVRPMEPEEMAGRMVSNLLHEQAGFMSYYAKFRFAFPDACNELIERREELLRILLTRALADKETYALYHPYPARLQNLFEALRPFVGASSKNGTVPLRKWSVPLLEADPKP